MGKKHHALTYYPVKKRNNEHAPHCLTGNRCRIQCVVEAGVWCGIDAAGRDLCGRGRGVLHEWLRLHTNGKEMGTLLEPLTE